MAHAWIKTKDEIERFRESGKRLAMVLTSIMTQVRVGMSTLEIDIIAEKLIREQGGIPVFKGYGAHWGRPFPATLCTSLNDEVVHGIPDRTRLLKTGDLLKLDIGMRYAGMVSDMARTMAIGDVTREAQQLSRVTEECLAIGIEKLVPGARISEYAHAVEEYVEANGFSVVRDLVGHGVGRELHEEPQVPNYLARHMDDFVVKKGMTLALEPMVNAGGFQVKIAPDEWTFITADGSLSAHFEDSVVITEEGAEVVTRI